jgi:hypothetical protein
MKVLWAFQLKVMISLSYLMYEMLYRDCVLFVELREQVDLESQQLENRQPINMDLGAGSVMPPSAEPTGAVALPLAAAGSSGQQPSEYQSLLGNIEIPEGVDPSFLAALPEDMRQEVIAEQLRLQRLRQRARAQTTDTTTQVYNTLNQLIFKNLCNSIYSFHSRPFWK